VSGKWPIVHLGCRAQPAARWCRDPDRLLGRSVQGVALLWPAGNTNVNLSDSPTNLADTSVVLVKDSGRAP
jgi:hypothetical protein